MRIVHSPALMQSLALGWRRRGKTVGFVPTMGALHEGHLSLMARARRESNILVVSVFVNPTQFGPKEDLKKYPRPFAKDRRLAAQAGAQVLFAPSPGAMYLPGFQTWVTVEGVSQPLEGTFRPGHFGGVATVVAKLFNIVQPTRAYFGQKDYQQWKVIERMVRDLNMPVEIVPCPTIREPGGLALSSRNAYLSPAERLAAQGIAAALRAAGELVKSYPRVSAGDIRRFLRTALRKIPGARVQYAEAVDPETLAPLAGRHRRVLLAVAVFLGRTRLIDNKIITN